MKKSILFLFACIPLFASCNNSDNGFPNPFPNDPYESVKVGFNLTAEENIKRLLSIKETELLDKTLLPANLEYIDQNLIKQENGEIHERDYTRAFAGVFGQGYTSSNMMKDETFKTFYQEQEETSINPIDPLRERQETRSNIKATYDYSYGQNKSEDNIRTIRYLAIEDTPNNYIESTTSPEVTIEGKYDEADITANPLVATSASIIADESESEDLHIPLHISQSSYVFKPTASDPVAGAYDDNHIVIIHEEHTPSEDYALPDGRTYKTAVNSLKVTRLVKAIDEDPSNEDPTRIGDYYLVERSRVYTEKAITSDVIQPNVPVTFLKNPIVINYKEEIHNFFTKVDADMKSDLEIAPVEIKL